MHQEQPDLDVGIIGGGPERELFLRPHVGESLVPSSTRMFRYLDFLPIMEREKVPHKFSALWTATGGNRAHDHLPR